MLRLMQALPMGRAPGGAGPGRGSSHESLASASAGSRQTSQVRAMLWLCVQGV